jgi:hypothetical protein
MTERPGGLAPPAEARLPDGRVVELVEPAAEVCRRYSEEFADEEARYGEAWMPWCRHDNQHILNWAVEDVGGLNDLDRHLDWLWGVLAARDFPVDRLPRNLELGADVMAERGEDEVATRLRQAAGRLRQTHS